MPALLARGRRGEIMTEDRSAPHPCAACGCSLPLARSGRGKGYWPKLAVR